MAAIEIGVRVAGVGVHAAVTAASAAVGDRTSTHTYAQHSHHNVAQQPTAFPNHGALLERCCRERIQPAFFDSALRDGFEWQSAQDVVAPAAPSRGWEMPWAAAINCSERYVAAASSSGKAHETLAFAGQAAPPFAMRVRI